MFYKINLTTRYHHFRIKCVAIPKNFFKIRYGQYEFLVMSFGFTNAPPIFLDFINYVFRPYLDSLVVVFIDKILFCSGCRK